MSKNLGINIGLYELAKMSKSLGFIAPLDQSGVSTPNALGAGSAVFGCVLLLSD